MVWWTFTCGRAGGVIRGGAGVCRGSPSMLPLPLKSGGRLVVVTNGLRLKITAQLGNGGGC